MPDLEPLVFPIIRIILFGTYVHLLWGITRDWRAWFWLLGFPVMPPEIQTMLLACSLLFVLRAEKAKRDEKTAETKSTASFFGPRPVS